MITRTWSKQLWTTPRPYARPKASFRSTTRVASSARPLRSSSPSANARSASNSYAVSQSPHLWLKLSSVRWVGNNICLESLTLHGRERGDGVRPVLKDPVWTQSVLRTSQRGRDKDTLHSSAIPHNSAAAFQPVTSDNPATVAFFQSEIVRRSGISCRDVSKLWLQARTRKPTISATIPLRINSTRDPLSMSNIASIGGSPMYWMMSALSRKAGSVK